MADSELTTIARPYARAAFSQALDETSGIENWSGMLGLLAAAIQQAVVESALNNPLLTTEDQAKLVIDIMGEELSGKAGLVQLRAGRIRGGRREPRESWKPARPEHRELLVSLRDLV